MDRNIFSLPLVLISPKVALRKESVDRNFFGGRNRKLILMSLSARRAWIEMLESKQIDPSVMQSLSARRAWIEMYNTTKQTWLLTSLSARRAWIEIGNPRKKP